MIAFRLGQMVRWTSQANGSAKEKRGRIVEIVPAGRLPDRERFSKLYSGSGIGSTRNHASCVVEVGSRYYWPRIIYLMAVDNGR